MNEKSLPGGSSRRQFMKTAAVTAAAATVGPQIMSRAQNDPAARSGVMGAGDHLYEWVDQWAKLPEGRKFGNTHAVIEDKQGRIFVHNQSPDAVAIFDPDGKFISSWGEDLAGGAHGMEYSVEDGQEFLYLATTGLQRVIKTTLDGEVVWTKDGVPTYTGVYEGENPKYSPTNVAVAPNGDFYVADGYGSSYIHQYDKAGEYIRTFGGKGDAAGQCNCPHGLWVDTRGEAPLLVVADRANIRLQYFTLDGQHHSFVTDRFLYPCHFHQLGTDLLVPDLYGRVTILDKNNEVVAHLGEYPGVNKMEGWPNLPHDQRIPGKFNSPHGANWDKAGNIFVAEWIPDGRVTKLRRVT